MLKTKKLCNFIVCLVETWAYRGTMIFQLSDCNLICTMKIMVAFFKLFPCASQYEAVLITV